MLLASTALLPNAPTLLADSPVMEIVSQPIPAERASDELELQAPTNSTLEIRMARRPWLFERLVKPTPPPSVKMNPPTPPPLPAEPPSAMRLTPITKPTDTWTPRRAGPSTQSSRSSDDDQQTSTDRRLETNFGDGTQYGDVAPRIVDSFQKRGQSLPGDENRGNTIQSGPTSTTHPGFADGADQDPQVDNEDSPATFDRSGRALSVTTDPAPLRDPDSLYEQPETLEADPLDEEMSDLDSEAVKAREGERDDSISSRSNQSSDSVDQAADKLPPTSRQSGRDQSAEDQDAEDQSAGDGEVTIRKLRIDRDGTPVDSIQAESRPKASAGTNESQSSGYVGDHIDKDDEPRSAEPRSAEPHSAESHSAESRSTKSKVPAPEVPEELDYTGNPSVPIQLNGSVSRMQGTMRQCLRYYYARPEDANERSNWGMLHSIMVFGADTKITAGNRTYSAIAWIAGNNPCRGQRFIEERNGRIAATSGVGLQGHQAQMLAILALCNVPSNYPLYAGERRFTVQDLVKEEMLACKRGEELTFTLIALSHYLNTNTVWRNEEGETWDFERLIREELSQPIVGAACGGTHRLMGFAHALRKRRAEGLPITGQWNRAEIFSQDFIDYTYRLQNRDGSMSTDWFEGREDNGDVDRKIQTTGHIVEWLLTITPDSQLQDPRLVAAVRFLLNSLYSDRSHDWKVGPKGHALRSLAMYYERVYQQGPAWRTTGVASGTSNQRR